MNRNEFEIEVCANSVESCQQAQLAGADRVELCAGIPEGGTTPSYGEISVARELLTHTRLHVIIRPRGGDFLYSPIEVRTMLKDIEAAHRLKADGVAFGCLTADGEIDLSVMRELMHASKGMSVTFHRAFDVCRNPQKAMEEIIELGCHRILTSGQQPSAEKGIPLLREMQEQAAGRIILLAGCGVNEGNIARIAKETGIQEFHFSARESARSPMTYKNESVSDRKSTRLNSSPRQYLVCRLLLETKTTSTTLNSEPGASIAFALPPRWTVPTYLSVVPLATSPSPPLAYTVPHRQ